MIGDGTSDRATHGWLDEVLEDAISAPSAAMRRNAVVALAAVGGAKRMEMFARLVGEEALRAKDGDPASPGILTLAIQELNDEAAFTSPDRINLTAVLNAKSGPAWVGPAKTILGRTNAFAEWIGFKRLVPRPRFARLIASVYRGGTLGLIALGLFVLAPLYAIYPPGASEVLSSIWRNGSILGMLVLVGASAFVGSLLATPMLRNRWPLVIDSAIVGMVTAGLGALALLLLRAVDNEWVPLEAALVYLVLGVPGFAIIRLLSATSERDAKRFDVATAAIAWPLLASTMLALAAQWMRGEWPAAASLGWVAFVLGASSLAAGVSRIDEGARVTLARELHPPRGRLVALSLTAGLLLGSLLATHLIFPDRPTKLSLGPRESSPLSLSDLPPERRFTRQKPYQIEIAPNSTVRFVASEFTGICVNGARVNHTDEVPNDAFESQRLLERLLAQRRMPSAVGIESQARGTFTLMLTKADACTGWKDGGPKTWLAGFARGSGQIVSQGDQSGYIYQQPIDPKLISEMSSEDRAHITSQPWRKPTAAPVFAFDTSRLPALELTATFDVADPVKSRTIIVERLGEDHGAKIVTTLAGGGEAIRRLVLAPGRYRICGRMENVRPIDCESLPHELLDDRMTLKFAALEAAQ